MGDPLESTTAAAEPGEVFAGPDVQVTRSNGVDTNDPDKKEWIPSDEENGAVPRSDKGQEQRQEQKKTSQIGGALKFNPTAAEFKPSSSSQPAQPDWTDNHALGHEEQQTTYGPPFDHFSSYQSANPTPSPEQQQMAWSMSNPYSATNQSLRFEMSAYMVLVEQHMAACGRCLADSSYMGSLIGHMARCQICQARFQDYMTSLAVGHDQEYEDWDPRNFIDILPGCHTLVEGDQSHFNWSSSCCSDFSKQGGYSDLVEGDQHHHISDASGSSHSPEQKGWDMEGCYTLKEHEEYLANENEIEGVEEESDLWWAIRRGRAEQAAEIISISIGKAEGLRGGDPRWLPLSKATSSRAISAGASSVTMVEAEAKAESAEAKGSMRLRGGGYPLLPRHERRSNGRRFRLDRKHGAGEGIMNKIRKGRSLDVVREEDDGVGGVAGTTGGRHDTSMVAEERGCGGGSEASVSKRPPALAGEGVVEEGFEAISVTGLADTNGSRTEEGKLNRQHISVDQPGSRPQQKTKDQDGKSSSKGSKKRGARSWLAGWLPWRSAPSTASKNIKKSTTDIKMDGTRKRSSSKRSPTPPARGSSSRAAGLKINTMVHDAEVTANKEDEPRTPSDGVSHSSSWSMVDGNSDRVGDSANTSDTSIEMAQEDKATATQTQYINSTTDDGVSRNEADTTTTEPEKIDYASMVGEAGDYFYDPYGTDSGRKDKGVAKDDELDRWYPDYREDRPVFRKRHGYHRHLGEFKTPSPYRLGLNRAVVDLRGEFRQITTQDLYHPDGSLSRVWGQSNEDSWNGLLRGDLDDRTGPPPVPELRRHGPSLAALSQGGMRGHGSGLAPPPGLGYPEKPIRGVPDIFGNDFESGGGRYDGETASLSYGEVMMQRKKNQAVNKLERARRKPRFSMPAMPDIPRGLGRLVGRVIGHGERGEDRIGEDDDEERGVVEHRENIAGGDGEDSSKGIESHFSVHRFGRQRR